MTPRTGGMRLVSVEEASALLRNELVGSTECDQLAVDCGLLRSCMWTLSWGERPVHTLRLLNLAVESSPDAVLTSREGNPEIRSRLRSSLNELADAGDVASLANGRWLPSPMREVRLATSDDARLLVGGFPTSLLPRELVKKVRPHGAFRRTNGDSLVKDLELPRESFDSWVGNAPIDVRAWTEAVLDGDYEAFSEGNDSRQFSVYAPQSARQGAPQFKRWFDRPEKLTGLFLGRREIALGLRQYRALDVEGGRVVRLKGLQLGTGDLRRLMYGLDLRAGNPVQVELESRGEDFVIVLTSELPRSEQRFFAALGQLSIPSDKYYPRTWRFPREYGDRVLQRLRGLGVQVFERARSKASS